MEISNPEGYVLLYLCYEAADLVVYILYSFVRALEEVCNRSGQCNSILVQFSKCYIRGYRVTHESEIHSYICFTSPHSH